MKKSIEKIIEELKEKINELEWKINEIRLEREKREFYQTKCKTKKGGRDGKIN